LWNVDANFGFSRYAERLGRSAFDELYEALQSEPTYIDGILISILKENRNYSAYFILISVPFQGIYMLLRSAQWVKELSQY
jgi:hypothetical protein